MSATILDGIDASYTGVNADGEWQIRLNSGPDKGKTTWIRTPPNSCEDDTNYMLIASKKLNSAYCFLKDVRHGMALRMANEALSLIRLQTAEAKSLAECRFFLARSNEAEELIYLIEYCLKSRLSGPVAKSDAQDAWLACRRVIRLVLIQYKGE